jgi:transposase
MFCPVDINNERSPMSTIKLSKEEHVELSQRAESQSGRADDARRARLILLLDGGDTWAQIRRKLSCSDAFIDRWSKRFRQERLAGLFSRPKHSLEPHRLDSDMTSDDPDFERNAADIICLYLRPPQHAAVFSVEAKSDTQAPAPLNPVLPLSPGGAGRHGFDYYRHGTLSLYAAFNTKKDEVLGKTAARHTPAEFIAFLTDIVVNQPRGKEIHVVADNLSAHKTLQVKDLLSAPSNVHLHFTPTYSSWLDQVELWFSRIERDLIARDVFTSSADLKTELIRYIRRYNKAPRAVKWRYFDPTRWTTTDSGVTVH